MRFGLSSGSIYSDGSKFFTSPAIWLFKLLGSKRVIRPMPLRPLSKESQKASSPMPLGASTPIPVITTRFRLTMKRLRGEIPWFYLGRFLNKLTVENGRASGVHQEAKF